MDDLKNIIESLLFVADEPLSIEQLKQVLSLSDTKMIRQALNELIADYEGRQGAFTLHEVAGGYQFRSHPDYVPWIKRLLQPKPSRLSKAALETLAIIAYKQPMIRSDIEHLRGVDCGGVLRMLLERKLIRVLGRKEIPGRPLIYATTKQFLQVFDLKNLRDLPSPKEIEALGIGTMDAVDPEDETADATESEDDTLETTAPEDKPGDEDQGASSETEGDSTQKELDEAPPDSL
ncbi:MAG: SMC-Scp complex subunit ScpB [Deltaproteobacteria bacterium]|nr:MAG: SMC-Scp complex subunit ScpB [Deltaproteobacteria bacterium]RLC16773.1 MAG: SMC-Scp complex subunit ScpB [Deltaproteobacteria bacterium]